MTWRFRNNVVLVLGFLAALGLSGCASAQTPKAKPTSSRPAVHDAKHLPSSEGASIAHDFFLRARRMEMEGNDAVALGYYRIAYEYDPTSRDLCFILLDHLKEAGRIDSAITLGKTCLKLKGTPTSAEYQAVGETHLRKDNPRGALEFYLKALQLDDDDKDALYTVSSLYEKLQDFPHFAEVMEKLLPQLDYPPRLVEKQLQTYRLLNRADAAVPLLRDAWNKTGRTSYGETLAAYYEAKDWHHAFLGISESLSVSNPENPAYDLMRARALNAVEMPDSALGVYASLLAKTPEEREVLFPYAALLYDLGRFEEAYLAFTKLADTYPQHPLYQYFLGSTQMELRKPEAHVALEKAVALESSVPDYWARLVYVDLAFGRDSVAKERLAHLPDSLSVGWEPPFFRGLVHALLARQLEPRPETAKRGVLEDSSQSRRFRVQAVEFFRTALVKSPQNRRVLFELGMNLERLGEQPAAIEVLRKLVKIDTGNAVALNYLGYILVENNKDLDYAGRLIDRALAIEADNGAYLDSKGWWHYRKGDFSVARSYLQKALERIPKDPTILEHLATVLDLLGENQEAKAVWERLLKVNPQHSEAKRKAGLSVPGNKAVEFKRE